MSGEAVNVDLWQSISFRPHLSDLDRWVVGSGFGFGFWWLGMALLGLVLSLLGGFRCWVLAAGYGVAGFSFEFGGWVRCWVIEGSSVQWWCVGGGF